MIFCAGLAFSSSAFAAGVFEAKAYGAKGDGTALDTPALQAAIDAAANANGGVVHVGPGNYRTTALWLKSHVTLDLDQDALLQGSLDSADWTACNGAPVIGALDATDIVLQGKGTIDGGGMTYYGTDNDGHVLPVPGPQCVVVFTRCQNAKVTGVTCRNSVKWTQMYRNCEHLLVDGVVIRNRESCLNRETDGIDINDSRHVVVQNCDIVTGDDALCAKSQESFPDQPAPATFDVVFRNCKLTTNCNATKIGTGTKFELYDVHFSGMTITRRPGPAGKRNSIPSGSCVAAISVQSNDSGHVHDLTFADYTVNDCDSPIFMEVQNRSRKGFGSVENITVSNFNCLHAVRANQINVEKGGRLKNIALRDITVHNFGNAPGVESPPYLTGKYPDAQRCGEMPAYGLFARCVDGLTLAGKIEFIDDGHSGRPATKYEDVTLAQTGEISAPSPPPAPR